MIKEILLHAKSGIRKTGKDNGVVARKNKQCKDPVSIIFKKILN